MSKAFRKIIGDPKKFVGVMSQVADTTIEVMQNKGSERKSEERAFKNPSSTIGGSEVRRIVPDGKTNDGQR